MRTELQSYSLAQGGLRLQEEKRRDAPGHGRAGLEAAPRDGS